MDRFYLQEQIRKLKNAKARQKIMITNNSLIIQCVHVSQLEIQKLQENFKKFQYTLSFVRTKLLKQNILKLLLKTVCYGNIWLASQQKEEPLHKLAGMDKTNVKNAYCITNLNIYPLKSEELDGDKKFYFNLVQMLQNIVVITANKKEHVTDSNRIE